jgi:hypothetical protein
MNTEVRSDWYVSAEDWERDFVNEYGEKFNIIINPSKKLSKYAPDLYLLKESKSADLKLLKEPFYKAKQTFNIPARFCWTFNPSDLFEYSVKHSDCFGIFIWKKFKDSEKYNTKIEEETEVYYTTLGGLKPLCQGKIHQYVRRMNDTNGNSYGSYGIDLRKLRKIV